MNTALIHFILRRYRCTFQTHFAAFTDQDLDRALYADGTLLLELFAERYGYGQPEAKAAWNDFVLRYVDGRDLLCVEQKSTARPQPWATFWAHEHRQSALGYASPHRGALI